MRKKLFVGISAIFLLLLMATAFADEDFAVDQPDGTDDETSGYFWIEWTPSYYNGTGESVSMDTNSISCFADGDGTLTSGYDKTYTVFTGKAATADGADGNKFLAYVGAWQGRQVEGGADYYIWCQNDQNTDQNAYSSGALTLRQYQAGDVGGIAIDVAGGILGMIGLNIGIVASILVVILIVVILLDMVTGTIGIIDMVRKTFGGQR